MKNKLLILTIIAFILTGLSIVVCSRIKAQISQTETKPDNEELLIVNSQPISNAFYEGLKENHIFKSSGFNLTKAIIVIHRQEENAVRIGPFEESYFMRLHNSKNSDERILFSIDKYKSPELASEILNNLTYSQGSVEITKDFGDEGIKGFDQLGKLNGVGFRKGKFNIGISCDSEKLIKVFAENALKTIEGK